jgi:hypothetical protein
VRAARHVILCHVIPRNITAVRGSSAAQHLVADQTSCMLFIDIHENLLPCTPAEGNIAGPSKEISAAAAQIAISNSLAAGTTQPCALGRCICHAV